MADKNQIVEYVIVTAFSSAFFIALIFIFFITHQKKMHQNALKIYEMKQAQEKELFEAINTTELKEKERIASNLHDEINMNLHLIKLNYDRQKKLLKPNSTEYNINHENAVLLNKAIQGLTASIFELVPKYMLQFGLSNSFQKDLDQVQKSKNISTSYINSSQFEFETHFSKNQLLSINRLVHEILNNLLKHSKCTTLNLLVQPESTAVKLIFSHDGKSVSNTEIDNLTTASKGLGLKSLKARSLLLQAHLDYSVESDGIATVSCRIPFSNSTVVQHT